MFIKDVETYRKVYTRKRDRSKFFIRGGKRVNVTPSRKTYSVKPKPRCQSGRERLAKGRCSKKCKPPRVRNPKTSRCKKM